MKRFLASLVLLFCLFGVYANAQKVVVGPSRGYGVDGGATTQTLNTTGTINSDTRNLLLGTYGGTAWTTGTATLPLISGLASTDVCIRIEDAGTAAPGNQISGAATFTLAANTGDSINGGAAAGTIGPFTTGGMSLLACRTAAHNWNVETSSIAPSSASSTQIVNGFDANGLTYATVATGIKTFWTTPSSANLAATLTDETGTGAVVFAGSPALTGTPTAPTATVGTNTTQLATTAFVIANSGTGGGSFTKISTLTANNTSGVLSWTSIGTYSAYKVVCNGLKAGTLDAHFRVRFSESAVFKTAGYVTGSIDYNQLDAAAGGQIAVPDTTGIYLFLNLDTTNGLNSEIYLDKLSDSGYVRGAHGTTRAGNSNTHFYREFGQGLYTADTTAFDGFQVGVSTGNLVSGSCTAYGMT